MLDTLLEAEKNHEIDTRGIYDEVATFLTAGYDTTKTAIMYLLFVIAQYPDIQDKVYDEVSTIYGKCKLREPMVLQGYRNWPHTYKHTDTLLFIFLTSLS